MSGLPKGWDSLQLKEIAKKDVQTIDPRRFPEENFDLFSIPSFSEGVPENVLGAEIGSAKQIVQPSDVLLSKIVPHIRRVWVVPNANGRRQIASGEWIVYRCVNFEPDFIKFALSERSFRTKFLGTVSGVGGSLMRASPKQVAEFSIPLPPLPEQKRIVAKLDALNAKSARARTELARIETLVSRYKQAVLSKAFSGELTREWRARVQVVEPRTGQLEELLSVPVRNGLSIKGSDTPPGFPALKLSALREREVRLDDVRYIPVNDDKASRFLLEPGDILVSRGNGTRSLVGIASIVPAIARPTIFPDTAFRIRVDGTKALPLWLTSLWNAPQVRSQIEIVAKTTAGIWKISQKDLATIQLSIPSTLQEQHEIVRRIEAAFARIDRLAGQAKRALELVGKLDEAILAKAFRGELVPQDENDEPADRLLARIRAERQAAPKAKRGRRPKA